jgi:predicted negative regulator of RcsB-dependent stress response
VYDTDEEQIEALKGWWQENGNKLIAAILVFALGYFGITTYRSSVQTGKETASTAFQNLVNITTDVDADAGNDIDYAAIDAQIDLLKVEHGKSVYATYAALFGARFAVSKGDLEAAASELNWALDQNKDPVLESLIQLRLARVEFARDNAETALKLLSADGGSQQVAFDELRGDILLSKGDVDGARAAYQTAWDAASEGTQPRPVLEMKLNDLSVQ